MNSAYIVEESETGLYNYISSSIADTSLHYYKGMNTEDKQTPSIIIQGVNADEDFVGSGIWHVGIRTYFIYPSTDSTGSLETRNGKYHTFVDKLYSGSMSPELITGSVSHLFIYDIYSKGISNSIQQDHWISENELEFVAVYKA